MKFTLTFPKNEIAQEHKKVIGMAITQVEIKGFRKGKAPRHLAEQHLDPAKISEEVMQRLLPKAYSDYIQKHKLEPMTHPRIDAKSVKPDSDWVFELEIAERPTVELKAYAKALKSLKPKASNKTPKATSTASSKSKSKKADQVDDTAAAQQAEQQARSDHMNQIFDALVKEVSIEIPPLLLEEEVEASLGRLTEQVEKIGLTLTDYLASMKRTIEDVKKEYAEIAERNLKIDFIIAAVAEEQKLTATQADLDDFLKKITDVKTKEAVIGNREQQAAILSSMTRQKTMEYLHSLAPFK